MKNKHRIVRFLMVLVTVSGLLLSYSFVNAGDNTTIVSPVKQHYVLDIGESLTSQVKITNNRDMEKELFFVPTHAEVSDKGVPSFVYEGIDPKEPVLKNFITLDKDHYVFQPGEKIELNFEVSIPEDAPPGEYFGAILVYQDDPNAEVEGGSKHFMVSAQGAVGMLVSLTIPGDLRMDGQIENFSVKPRFSRHRNFLFESTFKNSGNVRFVPEGNVEIFNRITGKKTANLSLENPTGSSVFPSSTSLFENNWGNNEIWPGFYRAKLGAVLIGSEGSQKVITKVVSFMVIPWDLLLLIVAIIIAIIIIIRWTRKPLKNWFESLIRKKYGSRLFRRRPKVIDLRPQVNKQSRKK